MKHSLVLLATTLLTSYAQILRPEIVPYPQLDLSSFNNQEIGLLGDFDALSQYKYSGASNFTNQNNLTNNLYYTEGDNDRFVTLGEVDGSVSKILPITSDTFLLLGNFSSIGDHSVSAPAMFNITSNYFTRIDSNSSIDGSVTTGLYDSSENVIYLGGDFTFNDTSSAALYNLTSRSLQSTLFEGFDDNSHVNSIIKVGENIIFGGQFNTLGLPDLLSSTSDKSNISVTTDQLVSLKYATFSSSDDNSSPDSLACPVNGQEWSVSGSTAATLDIGLPYTVMPSKVRIYNSANNDSQIQLFRLITAPADSIMNLTYVDPATGEFAYCDAWCPLLDSNSLNDALEDTDAEDRVLPFGDTSLSWNANYQDFGFVNSLDVYSFIFQALQSYGDGISLAGFEIYQSSFPTYANNSLNEPACDSSASYSTTDLNGSWVSSSNGQYLMSTVDVTDGIPDVGVTFYPNITYAGEYSILMYTPGCSTDNTCDYRGIVNVTVYDEVTNEIIYTDEIWQTNTDEKYDALVYDHLDNPVRVEMNLMSTVLSGNQEQVVVVADRILTTIYSIDQIISHNGTVSINGIFEYSPSNFTSLDVSNITGSDFVGNTSINLIGASLSDDADIQLAYYHNRIYVGGDFESEYGDNFFAINVDESPSSNSTISANASSVNGGLDGAITDLQVVSNGVLVLGDFENTNNETEIHSLSGDSDGSFSGAAFNNGSWFSFGDVDSTSVANVTLKNNDYWVFDNQTWDAENSTWYSPSSLLAFNVSAAGKSGDNTLFVGALRTSDASGNKGFMLSNSTLAGNITSDALTNSTITSGWFINESLSVFGGDFVTQSGITNLFLKSGNETIGLDIDWDGNTTVSKLFSYGSKLFIGTTGGGSAGDHDFNGVIVYNLNNQTFQSIDSLDGPEVKVNEFGYLNRTYLVVGGEFDSAGSQDCSGLCFYNMNETTWTQLIDDFSGTVNTFRFLNNTLVAGGDFKYQNDDLNLFAYDFNSTNQEQPSHFADIDFEVKKMLLVDNTTSGRTIVSGESSISAYDGSSWHSISADLEGSTIEDIQLLDLESSNGMNNGSLFDSDQVLFVSGNLTISKYGYANVAYFNSTAWLPFIITTHERTTATISSIFMNKDQSALYVSGSLTNSTRPSTTSSSTPTSSTTGSEKEKSGKMDRGFIVLVSLASAVGTIGVIGAIGSFFLFKNKKQEYMPLEPRVNEMEMLDTVPPENLLKHV
ncbi:CYFA0S01e07558g1_1 [Cyberlindnera fabianii]|uniref:CYFA0S01e07558g1_1 n=1 Tax=Cyberlindnera fabianii TaxID=36022 RepID=A0A061AQW5_CYBFA|nr:CYFA0S01e07558g1_1 [Cyberlindnera fabianii]